MPEPETSQQPASPPQTLKPIRVFVAGHCGPCAGLKEQVGREGGTLDGRPVELVDVETDEGFPFIEIMGLTAIPSAFREGEKCQILQDDAGMLSIACPGEMAELEIEEVQTNEQPAS